MKLPVLVYQKLHPNHKDVETVTTSTFRQQLELLKESGYTAISCKSLYEHLMRIAELPSKPILITFDNGHISQYSYAKSILKQQGFNAIFFVIGDTVLNSSCKEKGFFEENMNIEHLNDLLSSGFEVGFHGYHYINFKEAQLMDIQNDIRKSFALFKKLNLPVTRALAFPYGGQPVFFWKAKNLHKLFCQEKIILGFRRGNRINDLFTTDRFDISRVAINGNDSGLEFMKKVSIGSKWF